MDAIYERCCGIDVHKKLIVACFRCGRKHELRQFGATTKDLRELTSWLKQADCQMIAMESTGSYWKPLYNIFELSDLEAIVVNPQHMKNLPGRKTDIKDAEWISDLLQHGLLKASFIPDREQRELRELTRYRKSLVGEKGREINRLQKVLEGANVKLSNVVSDINGKSSINLLKRLVHGIPLTEEVVMEIIDPKLHKNISDIMLSLDGAFSAIQKALAKNILDHIDDMSMRIEEVEKLMSEYLQKYEKAIQRVDQIPGIGLTSARTIIAEIGIDMSHFPSEAHLCSWAGLSPGNNQSAGKKKVAK
jgi:transposase